MWVTQTLYANQSPNEASYATVTRVGGGTIDAIGSAQFVNIPVGGSFGLCSAPSVGDRVLILPCENDEYICLCQAVAAAPSEVILQSKSGAKIQLCSDGSISLNGLIVTQDGRLEALQ